MARRDRIKLHIPAYIGLAYILLSIILIPWTIYLGFTLPEHHLSAHWDVSWVGLDLAQAVSLLFTGLLAVRKSRWVVVFASITGSLLLVDAWFDVMSERHGLALVQAIVVAACIELPLAAVSFWLAHRALERNLR